MANGFRRLKTGAALLALFIFAISYLISSKVGSSWTTDSTLRKDGQGTALALLPGELPGYTGWARPEHTIAGSFRVIGTSSAHPKAGEVWKVSIACSLEDCYSLFYVRAYGPSVITGTVQSLKRKGAYVISFRFFDPGSYTVEVVLTFSNPPRLSTFPLKDQVQPNYEGYLVPGFPMQVTVEGQEPVPAVAACSLNDLVETTSTSALEKARWVVADKTSSSGHSEITEPNSISLSGYQHSFNSLGARMNYQYDECAVIPNIARLKVNPFATCPMHVVFIGDSVMRLQKQLFEFYVADFRHTVPVSFTELYGGTLKCRKFGPNVTEFMQNIRHEKVAVLFNTGLHDVHRLCGLEWAGDRTSYLSSESLEATCIENYRVALTWLVEEIRKFSPALMVFQTTTSGWPKFGNYGVPWGPDRGQALPLDSSFIELFNEVAFEVMANYREEVVIMDGYWISHPRPDNREVDAENSIGKKLAHPGSEVIQAISRIWSMILIHTVC